MSVTVVRETVRGYTQQHAMQLELSGLPPAKYDASPGSGSTTSRVRPLLRRRGVSARRPSRRDLVPRSSQLRPGRLDRQRRACVIRPASPIRRADSRSYLGVVPVGRMRDYARDRDRAGSLRCPKPVMKPVVDGGSRMRRLDQEESIMHPCTRPPRRASSRSSGWRSHGSAPMPIRPRSWARSMPSAPLSRTARRRQPASRRSPEWRRRSEVLEQTDPRGICSSARRQGSRRSICSCLPRAWASPRQGRS